MKKVSIALTDEYFSALADLADASETLPSRKAATIIKDYLDNVDWENNQK